jgi:hypothetical protein
MLCTVGRGVAPSGMLLLLLLLLLIHDAVPPPLVKELYLRLRILLSRSCVHCCKPSPSCLPFRNRAAFFWQGGERTLGAFTPLSLPIRSILDPVFFS